MQDAGLSIVGMATVDFVYVTSEHPIEDTENPVLDHVAAVGGPAGRSAIAAGRLGGEVQLLAMVGTGAYAELLERQLEAESVRSTWVRVPGDSQHSCVLVSQATGLRTTIWLPQPRANSEILQILPEFVRSGSTVLLDCTDEVLTRHAVAAAKDANVTIVIDTGSFRPWADDILGDVDHIVMPEKFLAKRFPDVDGVQEAARMAYELYAPTVLGVTQGSAGGFWIDDAGVHSYASLDVVAIDTCGAGDTFHGAYAWSVSKGLPSDVAFDVAAWSAGRKCMALGNGSIPSRNEMVEALAERLPSV